MAARLAGRDLTVLARPTSNTAVVPSGVEIRFGDLGEPLPLENVTTVVYCASMGFGHVPRLVEQLENAGVQRALFTSTTAIFASLPSASRQIRIAAEDAVRRSGLEWTILRPTMIYGTQRDRNISRLLRFLKRWPVFPLCGNALWQPIHVEDLADGVVAALDSSRTPRRTYNVAGAQPLRFADLIREAGRAVGRNVTLVPLPLRAAILAANITGLVTSEQVRRLAEDKAFSYEEAAHDFAFAPRTFSDGVRLEAKDLGLADSVSFSAER